MTDVIRINCAQLIESNGRLLFGGSDYRLRCLKKCELSGMNKTDSEAFFR